MFSFLKKRSRKQYTAKRLGFSPLAQSASNNKVRFRAQQQKIDTQGLIKQMLEGVKPLFKEQGWTKHRFTFNRDRGQGIVHVIQFELGSYDLSPYETPLTPGYYGLFRINVGVYLPECDRFIEKNARTSYISELHCAFRFGLKDLVDDIHNDYWIPLEAERTEIQKEVSELLVSQIFPALEAYSTREQIHQLWIKNPRQIHEDVVSDIDFARIFEVAGYLEDSAIIFRKKFQEYFGTIPSDQELQQWKEQGCFVYKK